MRRKQNNPRLLSFHHFIFGKNRRRKGIAVLWTAIVLIVLILFMGVAIDGGRVHLTDNQLQNAVDASSLAGARYVAWDPNSTTKIEARLKALEYANYNYAGGLSVNLNLTTDNGGDAIQETPLPKNCSHPGDIIIGRFISQTQQFIPTLDTPNAMRVVGRKKAGEANPPLPLIFGPIVNVADAAIQRFATAMIYNASGAAVIALSTDETGVYLHGNPELNIENGGSVYSNTFDVSADFRGNPFTDVAEFNLAGDYQVSGQFDPESLTYNDIPSTMNTGVPPIDDPYADLVEPPFYLPISPTAPADGNVVKITEGTHTLQPGYYPGGIEITGGDITMTPGIYQVNGTATHGGLSVTGGTTTADQVMFHVAGGSLDIRGNTQFTLTPPTSGDYAGIAIFQSRSNTLDAEINGVGGLNITGVLYFPNNHIEISGEGDTIGTQLIADTIEIGGTGVINIPYTGSPEIAGKSFLVE